MKKIIVCFMTLAAFIANAQKKAATDQKGFTYIHDLDYDEKVTHMLEDQHGNYTFLCVKTNVDSMLRIVRVDLNGKLKADIKKTNLAMRDFQHATHDQQGCLITGYRRYNEDKNTYTSRIIKYSPDFSSVVFDTVYRNFTLSGIHPVDSLCCIVTGTFYPQNIFSGIEINGHEVYIVMKIDARGRIKWVESFGTPGMCEGSDIAISP
ncbi:MAG TPA: hypothetical protein VD905_18885, partial [Flavobacteriales bacterium]|nr:hypothetical protein [Flavobacteriales bacterium]